MMLAYVLVMSLVLPGELPQDDLLLSECDDKAVTDKLPPELISGLRKTVKGKFLFDKKTGEIALAYDFSNVKQLQDFTPGKSKAKPVVTADGLCMSVGTSVTHVAKFRTMKVSATVKLKQLRGQLLKTDRVALGTGGLSPDTIYLNVTDHGGTSAIVPDKERSGSVEMKLAIDEERTLFQWGGSTVGKDAPGVPAGQLQLFGGENGFCFKNLVIAGELDPAWAEEISDEKKKN